jgi:acyl carrier protein
MENQPFHPDEYQNATSSPQIDHEALPETESSPERPQDFVEFKFAFYRHHNGEDARLAAKYLSDCDIVAIEGVGATPEERTRYQDLFNRYVAARASGQKTVELFELDSEIYELADQFTYYPLTDLAESGPKRIVCTDVAQDGSPAWEESQQADQATKTYKNFSKIAPTDLRRTAMREVLTTSAISNNSREALVSQQLRKLSESLPPTQHYKIGVGAGLIHTGIRHKLERDGFETTKAFIAAHHAANPQGRELYKWQPDITVIRQLQNHKNLTPDDATLNRLLLADSINFTDILLDEKAFQHNPDAESTDAFKKVNQVIEHLSDAHISEVLEHIDKIVASTGDENVREYQILALFGNTINHQGIYHVNLDDLKETLRADVPEDLAA